MLDLLDVIRNLGKNENNYISDEELNIIRSHKEEAAAISMKFWIECVLRIRK